MVTAKWVSDGAPFADAAWVRNEVFINEQNFTIELDEIDEIAQHLVLYNDQGQPIGAGRIFPAHQQNDGIYKVGRVCLLKEYRGTGAGRYLMEQLEHKIAQLGGKQAQLGAQTRAKGFYEALGYTAFGEEFMDEYCPHIMMCKQVSK